MYKEILAEISQPSINKFVVGYKLYVSLSFGLLMRMN